jgi:hypothetical protein
MLFGHPKVDNFWGNLLFFFAIKKYSERWRERVVQSCPLFGCINIISLYLLVKVGLFYIFGRC